MKNFNYTDTGDKIIIEMSFPQKFSFVGRADSVFKKLLEDNKAILNFLITTVAF